MLPKSTASITVKAAWSIGPMTQYIHWSNGQILEFQGSLEAILPTIWRAEIAEMGESELEKRREDDRKIKEEKVRSKKRKR